MRTDKINVMIGDMIYCHTPVIMEHNGEHRTTVGEYYRVQDIKDDRIIISNDINQEHHFSIDPQKSKYNSRQWFKFPRENNIKPIKYAKKLIL